MKETIDYSSALPVYSLKMKLAGVKIEVECTNIRDFVKCRNYLSDFDLSDFVIRVSREEIEHEFHNKAIEIGIADYHDEEIMGVEFQSVYKKIAQHMYSYDILLMHGSAVALDEHAYMFTASSGVGKSTRTRLWIEEFPNSIVVNGDKPLIKITESEITVCGTPWCGKEGWNTNVMVPLKAIFLLERAEKEADNAVEEINPTDAWPLLFQHVYWPSNTNAFRKTVSLLKEVTSRVKIYRFCSTPTRDSIRLAYDTVK